MTKAQLFSEQQQHMAEVFKTFAHPARLAILEFLAKQATCITGDISRYIPLSRTTVSQHLDELKEIGIIKGQTNGNRVNYCIDSKKFNAVRKEMTKFITDLKTVDNKGC